MVESVPCFSVVVLRRVLSLVPSVLSSVLSFVLSFVRAPEAPSVLAVLVLVFFEEPALFRQHSFGPCRGVPQLDPVDGTVHEHLGVEVGKRPQVCRDRHAPLPIDLDIG